MKAIVVRQFGAPEVMRLEDVADPKAGAGQVVVKLRAIGVNPVEAYVRAGSYAAKPNLPYTPGADAAGEIAEVGNGVSRFKPGDRVYVAATGAGTYAERVAVGEGQVHPLPDNASFEQGAAMGVPYATAYRALFQRGHAKAAETLLVHGATGGVGTAAVQLASAAGLVVIGTAGSEKGMALVKEQGARYALHHSTDGYLDELQTLTDGRGVDLIAEMLANKNLAKDLGVLAKRGRVVVIGNRGSVEINPRDAMGKESDIRGMTLMAATEAEYREIHAALVAGLEKGVLRPVIGQKFPLADAARAHEEIMKPSGAHGKIVLIP